MKDWGKITVGQLIERLSKFNHECTVLIEDEDGHREAGDNIGVYYDNNDNEDAVVIGRRHSNADWKNRIITFTK